MLPHSPLAISACVLAAALGAGTETAKAQPAPTPTVLQVDPVDQGIMDSFSQLPWQAGDLASVIGHTRITAFAEWNHVDSPGILRAFAQAAHIFGQRNITAIGIEQRADWQPLLDETHAYVRSARNTMEDGALRSEIERRLTPICMGMNVLAPNVRREYCAALAELLIASTAQGTRIVAADAADAEGGHILDPVNGLRDRFLLDRNFAARVQAATGSGNAILIIGGLHLSRTGNSTGASCTENDDVDSCLRKLYGANAVTVVDLTLNGTPPDLSFRWARQMAPWIGADWNDGRRDFVLDLSRGRIASRTPQNYILAAN